MTRTTEDRNGRLRAAFTEANGAWDEQWEPVLAADPIWFEACLEFASVPWRSGTLGPKVRELLSFAIQASTTQLNEARMRHHLERALDAGASREEIMAVVQIVSGVGIHSTTIGLPILIELAGGPAGSTPDGSLDERRVALKERFVAVRGFWHDFYESLLRQDADWFEACFALTGVPWNQGALEPKVIEFVLMSIDITTTHLFPVGFTAHLRNALGLGATPAEVMELVQLASAAGLNTTLTAVPMLLELLDARSPADVGDDRFPSPTENLQESHHG